MINTTYNMTEKIFDKNLDIIISFIQALYNASKEFNQAYITEQIDKLYDANDHVCESIRSSPNKLKTYSLQLKNLILYFLQMRVNDIISICLYENNNDYYYVLLFYYLAKRICKRCI